MDEARASSSSNSSQGSGQLVQTSANHDTSTIVNTNKNTDLTSPDTADSLPSISGLRILHYFETADNGVLLGIIGALALLTYFVLGGVGLLLIGLVSGFIFHDYLGEDFADNATSHGGSNSPDSRRRKELGIEVAARLLEWTSRKTVSQSDQDTEMIRINEGAIALDSSKFGPATAVALSQLIDAMVRDYVIYWYKPILPSDDSFPISCRKIIVAFITSLSTHITRKRSADTFLQFVTNSSSMIIVFLNELSLALHMTNSDSSATEDYLRQYLTKYPDSNLANVLSIEQQQKKMKMVAEDMLSNFLEPSVYLCEPVRHFLREILAGVVLESVIKSCSKPDFINGWIVYLLKEGEPEIMNAIDAGLESASKGDIAALSGVAGRPSQDLVTDIPSTAKGMAEDAPSLDIDEPVLANKFKDDGSILLNDPPHHTRDVGSLIKSDSLSSISIQGITPSTSTEQLSQADQGHTMQKFLETVDHDEHNLDGTTNANQEEVEDAVQILYGASVLVDDGSVPGDKTAIKAKPTTEYMLQIEPASTRYPGWMIFRRYQDFEPLHKGLETLSRYHQVPFIEVHPTLPPYRDQTKSSLAKALERYLRDALEYKDLAKSERLRRFLDKDQEFGQSASTPTKAGLLRASSTFENMGKGMLGVLSNAPKGVAGGGKAVFDGVTGVLAGVNRNRKSVDITSREVKNLSNNGSIDALNAIQERLADPSSQDYPHEEHAGPSMNDHHINELPSNVVELPLQNTREYERMTGCPSEQSVAQGLPTSPKSPGSSTTPSIRKISLERDDRKPELSVDTDVQQEIEDSNNLKKGKKDAKRSSSGSPITEDETRVAVELIFAVINELYTLSSAWNIRKTLLNAAKSYVLRPGNPHLESIRVLVQESMIDSNTTDEAIAANVTKLRENSLPTEEELKSWPPPLSKDESEKLKNEAKKLLIERGMPQILMGVMGAAASGEALGKVFDCLQVEEVGRGFMFALILQAMRAVIL